MPGAKGIRLRQLIYLQGLFPLFLTDCIPKINCCDPLHLWEGQEEVSKLFR